MKKILLYLLLLLSLFACAFQRDNPLDPENTGIPAPRKVTSLNARGLSSPKRVELDWDEVPLCNGYIVYRAGYYDGDYRAIKVLEEDEFDAENPSYTDNDTALIPREVYYYKVSAYKIIEDNLRLEGELSENKSVRVPAN